MKLTRGTHYGSFEPDEFRPVQEIEDVKPVVKCAQKFGGSFKHPLHKALLVLLVFAFLGVTTILTDHKTPSELPTTSLSIRNANLGKRAGCSVKIGEKESEVVLYHPAAPWEALVLAGRWTVPSDVVARYQDSPQQLREAFQGPLRQARALAGATVPYGDILSAGQPLPSALTQRLQEAFTAEGFQFCQGWELGQCSNDADPTQWESLARMDGKARRYFEDAIKEAGKWSAANKRLAHKLQGEAEALAKDGRAELDRVTREAQKEFEAAKAAAQETVERLREKHCEGRSASQCHAQRAVERAERKLEQDLEKAERKLEHIQREAEHKYNKLERKVEGLQRQSEKEADKIDRKVEAKLEQLKRKADKWCEKHCPPQSTPTRPTPAPYTPPIPEGVIPKGVIPEGIPFNPFPMPHPKPPAPEGSESEGAHQAPPLPEPQPPKEAPQPRSPEEHDDQPKPLPPKPSDKKPLPEPKPDVEEEASEEEKEPQKAKKGKAEPKNGKEPTKQEKPKAEKKKSNDRVEETKKENTRHPKEVLSKEDEEVERQLNDFYTSVIRKRS